MIASIALKLHRHNSIFLPFTTVDRHVIFFPFKALTSFVDMFLFFVR